MNDTLGKHCTSTAEILIPAWEPEILIHKFHGTFFLVLGHYVDETVCFRGAALAMILTSWSKSLDVLGLTMDNISMSKLHIGGRNE